MHTITRGFAGAALAAGLALTGGVAANAADGITPVADGIAAVVPGEATTVVDEGNRCRADFSSVDRRDGMFEYRLDLRCDELDAGVEARAVVTFENADGTRRDISTPWIAKAGGSESIRVATAATPIELRIEHRSSPRPIEG